LEVVTRDEVSTQLKVTCPDCRNVSELEVSTPALQMWQRGDLIQDAFPQLTPFHREQLITGYCDPCWQKMWAYLNDEEETA
jgi:hypothetical protein